MLNENFVVQRLIGGLWIDETRRLIYADALRAKQILTNTQGELRLICRV